MSKLMARLTAFARSPKGQAAIEEVRKQAAKPQNRRRIEKLAARWKGSGGHTPRQ
jgi:hypothetical protein